MNKIIKQPIVFFGSGPVAAEALKLIVKDFEVEAVITKPKLAHHKHDVPVVKLAEKLGLKILTALNKKELDNLIYEQNFKSQLAILIDFGIIVSSKVINKFELGIINSHFSLLPEWRGADPITFSLLSGQPKTGVSLMMIDEGMDTGKLLTRKSLAIDSKDTGDTLTAKLVDFSHQLLCEYLPRYISHDITPKNQPHPDRATYSTKISKQDGQADWSESAEVLERKVRAYQPWPRLFTELENKRIILLETNVVSTEPKNDQLYFKCGDDKYLVVQKLIAPSGKRMGGSDFKRGYLK